MAKLFSFRVNSAYLRFLLKRNSRFMILTGIAMTVLFPILAFTNYLIDGSYNQFVFATGRVFILILLVLSIFIVPFLLFSYLNSKKNLDVYHALPIKRRDLFFTTLLASFAIILIPYTFVYLVGNIYYFSVIPDVDMILLIKQYYFSVALTLSIVTPILFAMMNTGTGVDGLLYGLILHIIPSILYGAYVTFGSAVLLGFTVADPSLFLLYASPIWAIFELTFNTTRIFPNPMLISLYWIAFGLITSWVVLYFYQIRRSEKAEEPFTNKWFFPVFSSFFTFIVQFFLYSAFITLSGRGLDFRTLIFPFFLTFVMYLILDVIANRGFKHLIRGIINFAIIGALSLGTFTFGTLFDGFGYITRVPDASNVEKVELEYYDPYGYLYQSYYYDQSTFPVQTMYTDAEDIATIIDTHKIILEGFKANDYKKWDGYSLLQSTPRTGVGSSLNYQSSNVRIVYYLNSGAKIARSYTVPFGWSSGLLDLVDSENIFKNRYPMLANPDAIVRNAIFEIHDPLMSNVVTLSGKVNFKQFASAYKSDYLSLNEQQHNQPDSPILAIINLTSCASTDICITRAIPVDARHTQTLSLLASSGVSLPVLGTIDYQTIVVLPDATNEKAPFFRIQSLFGNSDFYVPTPYDESSEPEKPIPTDGTVTSVDYIEVPQDKLVELLPYIRINAISDKAIGVLRVESKIVINDRNSQFLFYLLDEGALPLLQQWRSELEVKKATYDNILYKYE
jgi:ABC-2 type transport system permease protein